MWILLFCIYFAGEKNLTSQYELLSTQLVSQERGKKRKNIFNSIWSCCVQDAWKNISLTSTLMDTIPHTGLKVDIFGMWKVHLLYPPPIPAVDKTEIAWIESFYFEAIRQVSSFIANVEIPILFILSGNKSNKFYKYYQQNQCNAGWLRWRLDPKMHYIFIMTGAMWHMVRCTLGAPHLFWMKSCLLQFNDLLSDGVLLSLKPSEWKD